mmetsp:Transcript_46967/g.69861  ORF Transcript_46967/g.69861 Transcript_46967/m.69861 type:complete len:210 (-) Transcript_46967:80-709(-)|eukprot:CAMPEP_0194036398 /NCGR_PEP_ID=MMETSP0009_2-20130614/8738_1 /TAXON_ID=210454 /ORGANISM="Grammatophora oceanica, Strain CCMP 410" /LENGTH=209 /DNA_ID=CAMNT_0038678121 /DNA_START=100 /DNA_END=729 /DNA_ORIENTATION=+
MMYKIFAILLLASLMVLGTNAFVPRQYRSSSAGIVQRSSSRSSSSSSSKSTSLHSFRGFGKPAKMKQAGEIFNIPVSNVKFGAVKFWFKLYLAAQVNTPAKGSWRVSQRPDEELLMIFHDGTGMLQVVVDEASFRAERLPVEPDVSISLQYMVGESVILHGVLDELEGIVNNDEVEAEKRLLKLVNPDGIETARKTLMGREDSKDAAFA